MTCIYDYYQASLSGSASWEQLLVTDRAELQVLIRICDRALAMPRRLGTDATSAELARDKKTAKRLAHCFRKSLQAWEAKEDATGLLEQEIRRRAATVRWVEFAAHRRQYLLSRFAPYATLTIDAGQKPRGYHVLNLLQNELGWLDYAIR